jgi:DNA polymerase III delta subunit
MLKVFCGNDVGKVRAAALAAARESAAPDTSVTTVEAEGYSTGVITDAVGASSLFGGTELFVIDTPSENSDFEEEVKNNLKEMGESANTFIVIEGALLAGPKKEYGKYAESLEEFKAAAAERLNVFSLADALADKDKKKLWLLLQEMKHAGVPEEEIIGILWWQLKSLRLAAATDSASEAGMKDFPYNKAKRALSKFKPGEIEELSHSLLSVYHDGHGGIRDIDTSLEHWVLSGK